MPSVLMAESALLSKLEPESKELGKKLEIAKKLLDYIFNAVFPRSQPQAGSACREAEPLQPAQIKCKIAPTSHSAGRSNFDLVRVEPVPSSCVAI